MFSNRAWHETPNAPYRTIPPPRRRGLRRVDRNTVRHGSYEQAGERGPL